MDRIYSSYKSVGYKNGIHTHHGPVLEIVIQTAEFCQKWWF
jgi:hypothetical protein